MDVDKLAHITNAFLAVLGLALIGITVFAAILALGGATINWH